jgi:hypothetical protein
MNYPVAWGVRNPEITPILGMSGKRMPATHTQNREIASNVTIHFAFIKETFNDR